MTCTNFLICCQKTTKTTSKYDTKSFGPVCQLLFVNLNCMHDSKPQSCVQQHKSFKLTRNATNLNKHMNEASKQTIANNLFKTSCKCTQGMFSIWKICFHVINKRTYNEPLCTLSQLSKL